MKTDRIYRRRVTNSFSVQADYPKGHLNGIMISINPLEAIKSSKDKPLVRGIVQNMKKAIDSSILKVRYRNDNSAQVLVSSIPLKHFVDLCDMEKGATGYTNLERVIRDVSDLNADALESYFNNLLSSNSRSLFPFFRCYIEIGSITCDNGDEIDIELDTPPNSAGGIGIGELSVYAVSTDESEPFNVSFYDVDRDLNELHEQVVKSWLISDNNSLESDDFDIEVRSTNDNYSSDRTGIRGIASLFNRIENKSMARTMPVFSGANDLPENVYIKVSSRQGGSLNNISVLNQRISSDLNKYFEQRVRSEKRVHEVLSNTEKHKSTGDIVQVLAAESQS